MRIRYWSSDVCASVLGPQHQAEEVELPLVLTRDVRAVHGAELAVEALVDDLVLLRGGELGRVLVVVVVDRREHRWERRAELEAQPAAVAQVVDPDHLLAQVRLVEVPRVERVLGGGHGTSEDVKQKREQGGARGGTVPSPLVREQHLDRKSTRLNSSH